MQVNAITPGVYHMEGYRWPVPNPLVTGTYMEITARFSLSAKYANLERTITTLLYQVRSGSDGIKDIKCYEIPKIFTGRDALEPKKWVRYRWILDPSAFVGKAGGVLSVWFAGLSQSTGPVLYFDEISKQNRSTTTPDKVKDSVVREDVL